MRILVTGAAGFLGGHLLPVLKGQGHRVLGLARTQGAADRILAQGCDVARGDVTDEGSLRDAMSGVEAVFHLAARVSVSARDRLDLERVNVVGTRNVVEQCVSSGVSRLVHVSSVVAVGAGRTESDVLDESSTNLLRRFNFPNCETKSRAEEIALAASRRSLDVVVVNPSMVFGAGDALKAPRKGSVLAARGRLAYYPRGGISAVGVMDVVQGMVSALQRGRSGERYILSGENLRMKDVLALYAGCGGARSPSKELPSWILRAAGRAIDTLRLPAPMSYEGAVAATWYHWFDHSKARKELGFEPAPVLQAIRESVAWMKHNGFLE